MFRSNITEKFTPEIAHKYLSKNEVAQWAQSCQSIFKAIKPALDARKLQKLAHYIVIEPNEEKVTAILTLEPTLVNAVIAEVKDNFGRVLLNNTIYQLAHGAGIDDAMIQAMTPAFVTVYDSEQAATQEMLRQSKEKFAEDREEDQRKNQQANAYLASLIEPVITSITHETFNSGKDATNKLILNETTLAAINTFRKEFTKSQPKVIEKGMHFNDKTLLEAYYIYAQAAAKWNYHHHKCALYEDGVLSHILSCVPASHAQKFSQGLSYIQEKNEPCNRSLNLRSSNNNYYLVARSPSRDFSLSGRYINIFDGTDRRRPDSIGSNAIFWMQARYQNFLIIKKSNLRSLCSQNDNPSLGM